MSRDESYRWRVGDVFTDGPHLWKVDSVVGDRAVLRSCSSAWATTMPLTFTEWHEGHRWKLVPSDGLAAGTERTDPA
jgi:hypothetical protein